jgi:predicted alpha-1,2-mannosidase
MRHDGKVHNVNAEFQATANAIKQTARIDVRDPGHLGPDDGVVKSDEYTVFSLWDTFRAAHPLYTIIDQKRTVDFINTFIRQYEQGGRLPVWELWGEETDTMIGYHAVSVIADAMAKGIKGFDYGRAYRAAKHSADLDHFGLAAYKKRGYISMEDENESVSKTLEYAYDDWCIAQMAKIMAARYEKFLTTVNKVYYPDLGFEYGKDYQNYAARARYFENLFDPKTGFFRPKKNGGFVEPFAPNEVTFGFTEGNSWQYSFFVPHDVTRLMQLYGGNAKFAEKLDQLFNTDQKLAGREQADLTGLIGQYAHGNEPSHHIAYLYSYAGEPWTTQKIVRRIMDEFYKPAPDGLIGNEDCGQMSAWYIMSASGFYQVTPGSAVYAFGTPLFKEIKYHLENGKTFTIKASNVSATNFYVRSALLNGQVYRKAFISHEDLIRGGTLEFEMSGHPFITAFNEFPVSSMKLDSMSVPVITADRTFSGSTNVTLSTFTANAKVYYTTDGSEPAATSNLYTTPSRSTTTTVRAIAVNPTGQRVRRSPSFQGARTTGR